MSIFSRRGIVILADCAAILLAFVAAFMLRFDLNLDTDSLAIIASTWHYVLIAHLVTAYVFGLYRGIYYFSSFPDLIRISQSVGVAGIATAATIMFMRQGQFPRSVLILHPILALLGKGGIRFGIRLIKTRLRLRGFIEGGKNVILVGAGELGESLLRQILKTPECGMNVVGFIDSDPSKWGMHIHDTPVLGNCNELPKAIEKYGVTEIIVSIGNQRGDVVRCVIEAIRPLEKRPELKIAPSLQEMLSSPHTTPMSVRKIKPADLLNRGVIKLDEAAIARLLERKRVLITGAGGSIGSELCRQALRYSPEKIVLVENHANSLFYVDLEMREKSHGTAVVPALGDVRDSGFLERVFAEHKPEIVIHAAAHKHVHQLEFNVAEGISNNILGTYQLATAADKHGVEAFLLISTDKAVKPSSLMGATKRGAERVVRSYAKRSKTRFALVRFGNVLGSTGSVLRLFEEQLAKGGPLTVTDERVTRYFMVVEEAVGLVLQAASMAQGGDVFILKMGTPVRIVDMAKNLILLHGLEPGKDIEIKITGLKQGEKLDEELVEDPMHVSKSSHPDITTLNFEALPFDEMKKRVLELEILARGQDTHAMLRKLQELVPTFKPADLHGLPPHPNPSPKGEGESSPSESPKQD